MSQPEAFQFLVRTTGGLRPLKGATESDLRAVRSLLLASRERETSGVTDFDRLLRTPLRQLDEKSAAELQEVIDAEASEGAESAAYRFRIRRRDFPVVDATLAGLVSGAESGAAIDQTFGPFLTSDDRAVWFDLFRFTQFVSVVRGPGGVPLLLAPVRDLAGNGTLYELDAGSVWINAQALAASVPAGSYSGLRIVGGRIELSSPATIAGLTIQVDGATTVTLTIQLDVPAPVSGSAGPGADARALQAKLPSEVTFVFAPAAVEVKIADEPSVRLYGSPIRLQRNAKPPVYDATVNRLLVPCDASRPTLEVTDVRSQLFTPSGAARIEIAAWALPVAAITPSTAPQAAGAGALAIITEPPLKAVWRGLAGGTARLGRTCFLAEPQRLVAVAPAAAGRRLTQTFDLWQDAASNSRHCALEFTYREPAPLAFLSSAGADMLGYNADLDFSGSSSLHIDRPVRADGRRLVYTARTSLALVDDATSGSHVICTGLVQPPPTSTMAVPAPEPIPFALSNALLKVVPDGFLLSGRLQGARLVQQGTLGLHFGVLSVLPTLPDPYAANLENPREGSQGTLTGRFTTSVRWTDPSSPTMSLHLSEDVSLDTVLDPVIAPRVDPVERILAVGARRGAEHQTTIEDRQRLRRLYELFGRPTDQRHRDLFLLDVSTHADQFGVLVEQPDRTPPGEPALAIEDVSLATQLCNTRIVTVPTVQWEPVWTIQNPNLGNFPSPLGSPNDGPPFSLRTNSVSLVPIAPRPVVDGVVRDFGDGDPDRFAAAMFTLPFGIVAVAAPLRLPAEPFAPGASLELVTPEFDDPALTGGLQIAIAALGGHFAIGPQIFPHTSSPTLDGAAIQLRNGIDPATRAPLNVSVLGDTVPPATEEDVPNAVESIFNGEFAPEGANPRVPVTKIDFSGYGASTFSRWRNPKAEFAQTSKAEFDVLAGRAAYEVVQVRSVLYPWGVRVVRTITIQRSGSGAPFRRDSGWVAVTDGVFDFPASAGGPKIDTHPGVVKAAVNVRRIRDTTHVYSRTYGSGPSAQTVRLAAVRFDADIRMPGVVRGAAGGVVTSVDQVGFVQLAPSGRPLSPDEYADLLADQGALGGPVDCVIDIGGSGQRMQVTRVDVAAARTPGGQFQFVAAARGSLLLPRTGQWSAVRTPSDSAKESVAVDRHSGVPLVRHGLAGVDDSVNAAPYKLADPAFLLDPAAATEDYGLLWSTGMQRLLFSRPKIDKGSKSITGERKPLLADAYALASSPGIFPSAATTLEVPFADWSLDVPGEGHMRLSLPSDTFPAVRVSGGLQRDLSAAGSIRMYVDYTNTRFTVQLDSSAPKSWSYTQDGIALVTESNGVTVKTTRGRIHADSGTAGVFTIQAEEFGKRFDEVKPILAMFASSNLSGSIPSGGAATPLEATNKAEVERKFGLKVELEIPEGVPLLIGDTGRGGSIEIATDFQNFFEIDLLVSVVIAKIFPGGARFKYEAEALKETIPGTSIEHKVGSKEALLLAIGAVFAPEGPPGLAFDLELVALIGLGFVDEDKPTKSSIGFGGVFKVEGTASYPPTPVDVADVVHIASAGITVEGQVLFVDEGDDWFLVLRGTLAFEITVALVLDIEFEIANYELARLPL